MDIPGALRRTTTHRPGRRARLRRVLSALAAACAVWLLAGTLRAPAADPGPEVVVAGTDLPVGTVLAADDLTRTAFPAALTPAGSLTSTDEAVGRTLAAPLPAGGVLTEAGLSTAALAGGLEAGTVVAHLPLASPALAAAAAPGTRVDVLSVVDGTTVAADVLVLAPDTASGAGVFVAVPAEDAAALARHGSGGLDAAATVVLRPPVQPAMP